MRRGEEGRGRGGGERVGKEGRGRGRGGGERNGRKGRRGGEGEEDEESGNG